ncbi:M28 family metallopeptidase [Spirosoma sp. KUDC1026]|uniref:M28 family metallopeptidase n=1 Tax=Spirosoma sp. KUDC1026 TaxID=2745947 RepID=UPI00159BBD7B|nr:M28 family metallopeptidase [Spirosoma sp. KUDC1026]QKZ14012.1 M28 family peptidase [Spirosoma sp. KUDC1026]
MAIHQQRLITYFFSLALLALGKTAVLGQTATIPAEAQQATSTVRPKAIEAHMRYLSDDKLEGRKPGTHGYELAAQYVEGELKKMGYKPAGERGTYRQSVPLRSGQVDARASSVVLIRDGKELHLNYGKNYILNPNFDQPRSEVSAPIVFVGYGISAPELGYDDYAQIDVNGKIVAYFNGAPTVFPSNQRAYYGSAKAEIAAAHGAVGVISFSLPTDVRARVEAAAPRARQATYRWVDRLGKAQRTFPQIQATVLLSDSTARSLFAGTAKSFDEAVAVAHRSYPQAFPLNASIRVKTQTSLNDDLVGQNVIGLLPGSDPVLKNEYVVYVSHLDHLGIGPPVKGDSIYNGAHDNASGVAINLETARLFASLPKAPRRSILFVGVTGEEMGLLGSDYFASNPTVPAEKLVANLCLDMPFFFHPLLDIVPYGVEHSSMAQAVRSAAGFLGVNVAPDPMPAQAVFMRSDHFSFVRQGIPAIYIKSGSETGDPKIDGLKENLDWRANIYHSPQDDMNQPFDWNAAAKHVQLQFLIGYLTAQADERPIWNEGDFFGNRFGRPATPKP